MNATTPTSTPDRVTKLLFAAVVLAVLILMVSDIEWMSAKRVNVLYLMTGLAAFVGYGSRSDSIGWTLVPTVVLTGLLSVFMLLEYSPDTPENVWVMEIALVYLLLMGLVVVHHEHEFAAFLRASGPYLVALAVWLGIFFYHTSLIPGSFFSVVAGIPLALSLFVFPRYVSRKAFLWLVSTLSAVVVLMGLPAYVIGDYTLYTVSFGIWGTTSELPFTSIEVPFLQSMFSNPNALGILTFAGTVAAFTTLHRSVREEENPVLWALSGLFVLLNGLGLYLSHSRSSWLAAATACALYFSYVVLGRRSIPYAMVAIAGLTALFLASIALSILPLDANYRFQLWWAGVTSIAETGSLLGAGIVATSDVLAPYLSGGARGYSVHNSYISMFVRAGFLGGIAYLVVTVGSLVDGALRSRQVDVGVLSLALGFAIHQMFESYTLMHYNFHSVLAALVFGFMILDGTSLPEDSPTEPGVNPL